MACSAPKSQVEPASVALARLAAAAQSDEPEWHAGEWGTILRHLLTCPLLVGWPDLAPEMRERTRALAEAASPPILCLGDLLKHPAPPLELLRIVKRCAKRSRRHHREGLPVAVLATVYYASICVARVRCGRRITNLSDSRLLHGLDGVLSQPWLTQEVRKAIEEGRRAVIR